MYFINYLHLFFLLILLACSFFLIVSRIPVNSVLLLILVFFCASLITILFGVDFMGILFLIVYVGAIAVLFLFVVMMLDLKLDFVKTRKIFFFFSIFTISFFIFGCFYELDFGSLFQKKFSFNLFYDDILDSFFNIDVFGQCLYNYFLVCFLIAGIVLLLAMLGAISLTLKYNVSVKNQLVHKQLSRTTAFLSFFK